MRKNRRKEFKAIVSPFGFELGLLNHTTTYKVKTGEPKISHRVNNAKRYLRYV
jgi:hypothetical protein